MAIPVPSNHDVLGMTLNCLKGFIMAQQTLKVNLVSPGIFVSPDGQTTIRELGEYEYLQVHSRKQDRTWNVPWDREAQAFQYKGFDPFGIEIVPLKFENGTATSLEVVVLTK